MKSGGKRSKFRLTTLQQDASFHAIQCCQVRVEKDSLAADDQNEVIDSFSANRRCARTS